MNELEQITIQHRNQMTDKQIITGLEEMVNKEAKGFQLTFPNGAVLGFWSPLRKGQKSYDLMLNNGKDNCYYKVGNITDIDTINEVLWNDK